MPVISPSLTIGMPVYNGSFFISRALNSILEQEFKDWILVVSDNCSTDDTVEIVKEYCKTDSRIKLVELPKNIGATNNFLSLAQSVSTPYFMWAASDDEWSSDYIMKCISALQVNAEAGFSGGSIVNIDLNGATIRRYKSFNIFSCANRVDGLINYLSAIEIDGKANLIYSVFLTPVAQTVCRIPNIFKGWGSDMAFVAAMLARVKYVHVSDVYLFKRVISESDVQTAKDLSLGLYDKSEFQGNYPPFLFCPYLFAILRGMPNWALKILAVKVMLKRLRNRLK